MAWRSSIARSIRCGASEREEISALIIYTIQSLANKLTLCSPMHDLLGLRIRGRVTGPPEVIPVLCRQWTLRGICGQWRTTSVHFPESPCFVRERQFDSETGTRRSISLLTSVPFLNY
jgi:hypothetical protein